MTRQRGGTTGAVTPGGALVAAYYLAFCLWLEVGCAVALLLSTDLPLLTALWQSLVCIVAFAPILAVVLYMLALPKGLRRLPRMVLGALSALDDLLQFVLPWAGWTAVLWLLNGGGINWAEAVRGGGAVALFAYLTGLGLILVFRPRPTDVVVTHLEIPIEGLPRAFDGYRVLHLSDTHAGILLSVRQMRRRLERAEALSPDLAVFTGDLSSHGRTTADRAAQELGRVAARDGMVAVLGNHDNWTGPQAVRDALVRQGATVLVNQHTTIERDGQVLYLAGVDDAVYGRRDDLPAALSGIPDGAPVILLSHAPDIVVRPQARRAAAVLCGHTHGGQIVLPWIGPVYVPSGVGRRYPAGLYGLDGSWLFVSRGMGEVFPPVRICCPPEMAVITLRRKRGQD